MHFVGWEKFCVDHGFARVSITDKEKQEGRLVFFDPSRIIQADEYGFTLNGSDESAGGRPSHPFSADAIPESGQPTQKSSSKCTVMQAINFADEALPPFIIYPTKAAGPQIKLHAKSIQGFRQVRGRYGLQDYFYFDPLIAMSKNGSMTKELWMYWLVEYMAYLYPDVQDKPGLRLLIKVDSGPGKHLLVILCNLLPKSFLLLDLYYRPKFWRFCKNVDGYV
jgi:hypothetical protein